MPDAADDNTLLTATLTKRQWREIKKALQKRRSYINDGIRKGTATQQDRIMVDAVIAEVDALLAADD
jgi:hypothetical protein